MHNGALPIGFPVTAPRKQRTKKRGHFFLAAICMADGLQVDSNAPWNQGARVSLAMYVEEMLVSLQLKWASDSDKAHWAQQVKGLRKVVSVVQHAAGGSVGSGPGAGVEALLPTDGWVPGSAAADVAGCGPQLRAWLLALQCTVEACALPTSIMGTDASPCPVDDGLLEAAMAAVPIAFGQDVMMVMLSTVARVNEVKVRGAWCPLTNWLAIRTLLFLLVQRWHASPAPVEVMVICLTSVLDALHRTPLPSDPLVAAQVQGVFLPLTLGLRVFFKLVPEESPVVAAAPALAGPRPTYKGAKRKAAARCERLDRHDGGGGGGGGGGVRVVDTVFPTASSVDLGKEHVRSLMQRVANRWLRRYPALQAVVLDLYRECGLLAQGLPPLAMGHTSKGLDGPPVVCPAWVPKFWNAATAPGVAEAAERQWRLQVVTWLQLLLQVYGDVGMLEGMVVPENMPRCGGQSRLLLGTLDMTSVFALADLLVKAVHSYVLLTGRDFRAEGPPPEARVLVPPLVALADIVLQGHAALYGDGDGAEDGADDDGAQATGARPLVFPGVLLDHLENAAAGMGILQTARVPGSDMQEHWDSVQCRTSSWVCVVYNFLMVVVQVRRHSDAFGTTLWPGPVYAALNKLAVLFAWDARLANLVTALVCPETDPAPLGRDDHWTCVGHPLFRRVQEYSGCLLAMLGWQCEVAEMLDALVHGDNGGHASAQTLPPTRVATRTGREQLAALTARSGQQTRRLLGAMCDLVAYLSPLVGAQETVFVAHCFRTVRSCSQPADAVDMLRAVAVILDATEPPRGTGLYSHVASGLVTLCSHWVVRQWEHAELPAFILWRLAGEGSVLDVVQAHMEVQASLAADRGVCKLGCRVRGCHTVHDPQLHTEAAEACFVPVKPLVVQAHVWATLALCASQDAAVSAASWRDGVVFALNDLVVAARRMLPQLATSPRTSLTPVQAWDAVMAQCAACVIACPQAAFLVDLLCRPLVRSDVWMFIDPVMAAVEGKLPQVLQQCVALEQEVLAHMPPKGPWAPLTLQPPGMSVAAAAVTVAGSHLAAVLVWAKTSRTEGARSGRAAVVLPLFAQAVRSVRLRLLYTDTLVGMAALLRWGSGLQHAARTVPECLVALVHVLAMECGVLHGAVRRETRTGVCANDGWSPCLSDADAVAAADACSPPWAWVGLCMDAVCALCLDTATGLPVLLRGALTHEDLAQDVFLPMVDLLANGGNLWSAPLVLRVCAALVHPEIVEVVAPLGGFTIAALLHVGAPAFAHPHPDAQALLRAVVDVYA